MFVHNSYFVKLEILRSFMFDTDTIVIDPENEYEMIAKAVGGNYIAFSTTSANKINPFQIASPKAPRMKWATNIFLELTPQDYVGPDVSHRGRHP